MLAATKATLNLLPTPARSPIVPPQRPAKPTKAELERALGGDDPAEAARVLSRFSPRQRQAIFGKPLASGLVPVLDAARRGATQLLPVYAGLGASLGVTGPLGFDAVFTALFEEQEPAAKTMLDDPGLRDAMAQHAPLLAADVEKLLRRRASIDIDEVTVRLTDMERERFNSPKGLALYFINVFAAKDPDFLKTLGLAGQGWSTQDMCVQRVRTLLTFAATPELSPADRAACLREAALFAESLRVDRRVFSAHQTCDTAIADAALSYECDNILAKLDTQVADGNRKLVALVVPISTPLHAMYLTVEPAYLGPEQQPGYMIHFDNRGAGNEPHQRAANGQVYPVRTSVPQTPRCARS